MLLSCSQYHRVTLAVPKICFGLGRRQILTAAPSSPRFIRHRRRFGDDAAIPSLLFRQKFRFAAFLPIVEGFLYFAVLRFIYTKHCLDILAYQGGFVKGYFAKGAYYYEWWLCLLNFLTLSDRSASSSLVRSGRFSSFTRKVVTVSFSLILSTSE